MDIFATEVMERYDYFPEANFEIVASSDTYSVPVKKKKKKKSNNSMNKRRFSDEQVKSLESIFYSSDSKLDPRKKAQLSRDLGLQPRQIAIWFQNRRARWKSKQIEKDLRCLRANYDDLASQFESLQEEKNSLHTQLQKLSELLKEKPHESSLYNTGDTSYETEATPRSLQEQLEQKGITYLYNNHKAGNGGHDQELKVTHPILENKSNNTSYTEEQDCRLLDVNGSSESSQKWCDFDSCGSVHFEYQQCNSLQWLNFWG